MEETVSFYSKKGKTLGGLFILLIIAIIFIGSFIYLFPSISAETAPIKQKICLYVSPFLFILIMIVLYSAFRTYSFVSKGLAVLIFTPKEIRQYNAWINDYICIPWDEITGIYKIKNTRNNIVEYRIEVKDRDHLIAHQGIKKHNFFLRMVYLTNSHALTSITINSLDTDEQTFIDALRQKNKYFLRNTKEYQLFHLLDELMR
ncbi:MAG: hypothetical protein IJ069_04460 [Prevotella sp.]|nr:hypothetical protein [Prevotella sp.]